MAQKLIAQNKFVDQVTYALPNKHYVPIDMKYIGIDNVTPLSIHFIFVSLVPLPRDALRLLCSRPLLLPAGRLLKGPRLKRTLGVSYLCTRATLLISEELGMAPAHARGRVEDACQRGGYASG